MSFNENSTMDATDIDHGNTGGGVAEAEREDTNANPEGVWRQPQQDSGVPAFVLESFDMKEVPNPETGEIRRFLNVRPAVVEELIKDAPNRLSTAIENLTDEDYTTIEQLAKDIESLLQTASVVDQYFENGIMYNLTGEIARNCVKATNWRNSAKNWAGRLTEQQDTPDGLENLINMVRSSSRVAAMVYSAISRIKTDFTVNYKAAAWQEMQREARRLQERYMGAVSNQATGNANANNATAALIDRL